MISVALPVFNQAKITDILPQQILAIALNRSNNDK